MIDFSSILTTLWHRVSNPIPNVLIGITFLLFAPNDISWIGYIFLSIGCSSIAEHAWNKIKCLLKQYKLNKSIKITYKTLNENEKELIDNLIRKNELTINIKFSDYYRGMKSGTKGNLDDHAELIGTCEGLRSKDFFTITTQDRFTSYSIFLPIWKIIKKEYKKNNKNPHDI